MVALRDCDCESYIIEELISAGASLTGVSSDDASNNAHITARNAFDRRYNVSSLALVAPHVGDINATDKSGKAAIHYAAIGGSDAMAEIICNSIGSKVDAITSDGQGRTAFHYAAMFGFVDVLRVLIHHGAEKEFRASDGLTALQLAIIQRQKAAANVLLGMGAKFVYQSKRLGLCTVLHASSGSNPERSILRDLLETHPQLRNPVVINCQDRIGYTALHWAAHYGDLDAVEALLDNEADRNIRDTSRGPYPGKTPRDIILPVLKTKESFRFPKSMPSRRPQAVKAHIVRLEEIKRLLEMEHEGG